jgi:hypothetical protein
VAREGTHKITRKALENSIYFKTKEKGMTTLGLKDQNQTDLSAWMEIYLISKDREGSLSPPPHKAPLVL